MVFLTYYILQGALNSNFWFSSECSFARKKETQGTKLRTSTVIVLDTAVHLLLMPWTQILQIQMKNVRRQCRMNKLMKQKRVGMTSHETQEYWSRWFKTMYVTRLNVALLIVMSWLFVLQMENDQISIIAWHVVLW